MTNILDTIDNSLQEVEEQLLQEFDRIRNTLSDARFEAIDPGIKTALGSVVADLRGRLEQTGDRENLQLMTERHEILFARMGVLRQLLNAKIPTAFLHEAHQEVKSNRKKLEAEVEAQRRKETATESAPTPEAKSGFVSRLKGMFKGNETEKAVKRNRIQVTAEEQKNHEPVSIYLDNGIYSASRELAALANVFSLPKEQQEALQDNHEKKMQAIISGKAQFQSRDLSNKPPEEKPGKKSIAQTPEEIRRKLAERQNSDTGKASFVSKDINHVAPVTSSTPAEKPKSAAEIAAERRRELEAEKAKQPTTGKASFVSKDIEPVYAQEAPRKKPEPEKKPEPPRSGKAVFESRDLSNPPPRNK